VGEWVGGNGGGLEGVGIERLPGVEGVLMDCEGIRRGGLESEGEATNLTCWTQDRKASQRILIRLYRLRSVGAIFIMTCISFSVFPTSLFWFGRFTR